MVRGDTEEFEAFLHRDADGAAAAPETDQEVGPEPRLRDVGGELEGVLQQAVSLDE